MTTPKPLSSLPIKQQLFVLHYPQCDHNATQAAIAAGYSAKTAEQQGHQLLRKLQSYIAPLQQDLIARVQMSAEEVVERLAQIARSDIRDVMEWDTTEGSVKLKSSSEIKPEAAYAISEIRTHRTKFGTEISVKMHDKAVALVSLGRYHNLFKRTTASKGLVVMFGSIQPGNQKQVAQLNQGARKLLTGTNKPVEVTFTALPDPKKKKA